LKEEGRRKKEEGRTKKEIQSRVLAIKQVLTVLVVAIMVVPFFKNRATYKLLGLFVFPDV
jgi:hypothetical protein